MSTINPVRDTEIARQKRNLTESQKKNAEATREGVLVNELIKEPKNVDMNDLYNCLVISNDAKMPEKLFEPKYTKEKSIVPISLISTGVMAGMTLVSLVAKKSAKANLTIRTTQKLPSLTRNLAMNQEAHQAMYQMVQCPNQKTILAAVGILTISSMGFMGKMFIDGFKDIWVKKREADIQKNLQENLVAVETQSFSGKIQIVRGMLAEKAHEFNEYLAYKRETPTVFKQFNSNLMFMGRSDKSDIEPQPKQHLNRQSRLGFLAQQPEAKNALVAAPPDEKSGNGKYFALGALTIGAIVALGYLSMRNLRSGKKYLEQYIDASKSKISEIVANSSKNSHETDKINLKNMLQAIDASPNYIQEELAKLKWDKAEKEKFIDEISFQTKKSTAQAERALGGDGTPKPAFYSHVNDYRAFLYNWLLDTSNPLFRNLFFGITGVTALAYGGKALGEAVKDVQVKKINAQTELELQKRLVATELRNFKAKKDAAINPLCEEFYVQLNNGKPKDELKVIAENILFEVKNGPPFVYS